LKFFVFAGKFRAGFGIFFFKNPKKLKEFPQKCALSPKYPSPEYATGQWDI